MLDSRFVSASSMSIDIRMRESRDPMDLASILNPSSAPPSSDSEKEWNENEEELQASSSSINYNRSFPRPMEVDGEVRSSAPGWSHNEGRLPILPPMQLSPESSHSSNLVHQQAQGLRTSETLQSRVEHDLVRCPHKRSHSPRRRHRRDDRRGSYPHLNTSMQQLRISPSPSLKYDGYLEAQTGDTCGKKKKKRKPTGPHSNKAYTQEQVHWLRYHAEDCHLNYKQMYDLWKIQFPGDCRMPGQAFCSRLYRDNISAMVNDNDELIRDRNGKPKIIVIGVRSRSNPKYVYFPFKFWEKNPEWALYWDWVMPEHKALAQKILDGRDLDASQLVKEKSRRAIRKYEAELPAKKGWFATPALHAAAKLKTQPMDDINEFNASPSTERMSMDIKLETEQASYWASEYDLDSNGHKIKIRSS